MKVERRFVAFLMSSRPFIIVALSAVSGWTTWKGLQLFIHPFFALVLTIAVQTCGGPQG